MGCTNSKAKEPSTAQRAALSMEKSKAVSSKIATAEKSPVTITSPVAAASGSDSQATGNSRQPSPTPVLHPAMHEHASHPRVVEPYRICPLVQRLREKSSTPEMDEPNIFDISRSSSIEKMFRRWNNKIALDESRTSAASAMVAVAVFEALLRRHVESEEASAQEEDEEQEEETTRTPVEQNNNQDVCVAAHTAPTAEDKQEEEEESGEAAPHMVQVESFDCSNSVPVVGLAPSPLQQRSSINNFAVMPMKSSISASSSSSCSPPRRSAMDVLVDQENALFTKTIVCAAPAISNASFKRQLTSSFSRNVNHITADTRSGAIAVEAPSLLERTISNFSHHDLQ